VLILSHNNPLVRCARCPSALDSNTQAFLYAQVFQFQDGLSLQGVVDAEAEYLFNFQCRCLGLVLLLASVPQLLFQLLCL
jgi:hypothetical protein